MARIELKDGSFVEAPDDLTPEEKAWLDANRKPSTAKDVGKSIVSGLAEGAIRAPFIFGDALSLGARGVDKVLPGTIPKDYEKLVSDRAVEIGEDATGLQRHVPETTPGRYANAGANALGGAAAFNPMSLIKLAPATARLPGVGSALTAGASRLLRTPTVAAPIVGMGAQAGADVGGPVGGFAGGVGTQLALSLLSRQLTPNHPNWIQDGTKSMGPDDWEQAFKNRANLEKSGSTSYTLTDAMPDNAQIRGFTRDLSNSSGADALVKKLAGRNSPGTQSLENGKLTYKNQGDIPRLLDEASEALYPNDVNVGQLTNQVADSAQGVITNAKTARRDAYLPILQDSPPVTRKQLAEVVAKIRQQANSPQNAGTVDQKSRVAAANALATTPQRPVPLPPGLEGPPVMGANLEALSKNVKNLQKGIPVPEMGLDRAAGYGAYKTADAALKEASPWYTQAMQEYMDQTTKNVAPLRDGLVGQLAKLKDRPPSENALTSAIARAPVEESSVALTQVATDPTVRSQLARVIADSNKKPLKTAGPGIEGVQKARQTAVDLSDPTAAATYANKTGAADTLSRLTAEAGADSTARANLSRSGVAAIAAPFLEIRNRLRLRMSEKETTVLSNLLANPTEQNMKLLQKIATERPDLAPGIATMQRLGSVQAGSIAGAEYGE